MRLVRLALALAAFGAVAAFFASPYLLGEVEIAKNLYLEENARVLARLPVYPGSRETRRFTTAYRAAPEGPSPIAGWTSTVVYRLRRPTPPPTVISFYRSRLDRWRAFRHAACRSGRPCARTRFVRGDAALVLDARRTGAPRRATYSLTVDYTGAIE